MSLGLRMEYLRKNTPFGGYSGDTQVEKCYYFSVYKRQEEAAMTVEKDVTQGLSVVITPQQLADTEFDTFRQLSFDLTDALNATGSDATLALDTIIFRTRVFLKQAEALRKEHVGGMQ